MNKKNVHDERKFMTESIGGSAARFGAFDDSESYIDKNDATSTCLNYGEDNQSFIERAAGREDAVQRRVVLEN